MHNSGTSDQLLLWMHVPPLASLAFSEFSGHTLHNQLQSAFSNPWSHVPQSPQSSYPNFRVTITLAAPTANYWIMVRNKISFLIIANGSGRILL